MENRCPRCLTILNSPWSDAECDVCRIADLATTIISIAALTLVVNGNAEEIIAKVASEVANRLNP